MMDDIAMARGLARFVSGLSRNTPAQRNALDPRQAFEHGQIVIPTWGDKDTVYVHEARQRYNVIAIAPESQIAEVYLLRDHATLFTGSPIERRILVGHKHPFVGEIDGPFSIVTAKNIENSVGMANGKLAALSADYNSFMANGQARLVLDVYAGVPPIINKLRPQAFFAGSLDDFATITETNWMEVPAFGREYGEFIINMTQSNSSAVLTYNIYGVNYFGTVESKELLVTDTISAVGAETFNSLNHFDAYRISGSVDTGSADVSIQVKLRDAA